MCICWSHWVSFKAPISLCWIPETWWPPDLFRLWFTLFAFLVCSASHGTVKPRTQAAPITVSSAQLGLLHAYYSDQFSAALLTYLLTPWCRVLLEKLTGLQLVKKFPAFYGTRRFITALTSFRHLSLYCASPIQSTYPHPTSWRSILCSSATCGKRTATVLYNRVLPDGVESVA